MDKSKLRDIAAMLNALCDEPGFAAAHDLTIDQLALIGDLDGDGKFTNADIQSLLHKLSTPNPGNGPLTSVPEPSSFILLALGGIALLRRKGAEARTRNSKPPQLFAHS